MLDWEVAHVGDPIFDVAFLVSHLICKSLYRPTSAFRFREASEIFLSSYLGVVSRDLPCYDETYFVQQIACLVLARIDGKSPLTYLDAAAGIRARSLSSALLLEPMSSLEQLWKELV